MFNILDILIKIIRKDLNLKISWNSLKKYNLMCTITTENIDKLLSGCEVFW